MAADTDRPAPGQGGARAAAPVRVCVGAIAGSHGVRGAVRIKSFTDWPDDVAAYGAVTDEAGGRRFEIKVTGRAKGVVVATLGGVTTREAADALKGLRLYVERDRLPPAEDGEFYHADLIGLDAVLGDGAVMGRVSAVHDFGAGDLLEIATPDGKSAMIPFTLEAVPEVDVAGGRVVVAPPPGLLDDGEANPGEADSDDPQAPAQDPVG